MRWPWPFTYLAVGWALGCREPQTSTKVKSASRFEADSEYQEGLSKTLESAPTAHAVEILTHYYDLGYSTGNLEALEDQEREHDENEKLGCEMIVADLLEAHPQTAGLTPCATMIRPAFVAAKFSGPRFYNARLLVVRNGAEAGDPDIAHSLLNAYENGYAMGFTHAHEAPGGLDRIRSAVEYGCNEHIFAENRSAPFTNDRVTQLAARCETIAGDAVTGYVNERANRRGQP